MSKPSSYYESRYPEETKLIRRCQNGNDQDAYEQIVAMFKYRILAIVRKTLFNKNDAEDIVQNVFIKVYFSISRFNFRSSFYTWLVRITVNECLDYLRKKKVRPLVYEGDMTEEEMISIQCSYPVSNPRMGADVRIEMRGYLNELFQAAGVTSEIRRIFVMKEIWGYSMEELARMTGTDENTLKVQLFRARKKMIAARNGRVYKRPNPKKHGSATGPAACQ